MRIQASQAAFINGEIHVRSVFTEHRARTWVKHGHHESNGGQGASASFHRGGGLHAPSVHPHQSEAFRRAALAAVKIARKGTDADEGESVDATSEESQAESAGLMTEAAVDGVDADEERGGGGGGGDAGDGGDASSEGDASFGGEDGGDPGTGGARDSEAPDASFEATHDDEEIVVHEKGVIVTSDGEQYEFEAIVEVSHEVDAIRTVALKRTVHHSYAPSQADDGGSSDASAAAGLGLPPMGRLGQGKSPLGGGTTTASGALLGARGMRSLGDSADAVALRADGTSSFGDGAKPLEKSATNALEQDGAAAGDTLTGAKTDETEKRERDSERGMMVDDQRRLVRDLRLDVQG